MFKKIISILLLGFMPFTMSLSADDFPVFLPLQKINNGSVHPGQRTPANYSFLPTVLLDEEEAELIIEGNANLGIIPYVIMDEDGNTALSGSLTIYLGSLSTIDISTLPSGDYTIQLTINDAIFEGEFSK